MDDSRSAKLEADILWILYLVLGAFGGGSPTREDLREDYSSARAANLEREQQDPVPRLGFEIILRRQQAPPALADTRPGVEVDDDLSA